MSGSERNKCMNECFPKGCGQNVICGSADATVRVVYTPCFIKSGPLCIFFNNILPCGPISIIDIPNCSEEYRLAIRDTFTYLTFRYSLKIVTSHPRVAVAHTDL